MIGIGSLADLIGNSSRKPLSWVKRRHVVVALFSRLAHELLSKPDSVHDEDLTARALFFDDLRPFALSYGLLGLDRTFSAPPVR